MSRIDLALWTRQIRAWQLSIRNAWPISMNNRPVIVLGSLGSQYYGKKSSSSYGPRHHPLLFHWALWWNFSFLFHLEDGAQWPQTFLYTCFIEFMEFPLFLYFHVYVFTVISMISDICSSVISFFLICICNGAISLCCCIAQLHCNTSAIVIGD